MKQGLILALILFTASSAHSESTIQENLPSGSSIQRELIDTRSDRHDLEFNTGGSIDMVPIYSGTASEWSYFTSHVYENWAYGVALIIDEVGFLTNANSTDPIDLPVDWFIHVNMCDPEGIEDPYTHVWTHHGQFNPEGAEDTDPPNTYTIVDVEDEIVHLFYGWCIIWGFENAGLCGMTDFSGETTYGWSGIDWVDESESGKTTLMQFKAYFSTPIAIEENSVSGLKLNY